ncbi:right-handed parallel beta-helix repeat-containing protein [Arcicella rigui]|uniref:Right handed beta helix domain-containing protein n=1 Tax=Arcicella rigui TaxID=797020 RepID=A0ABU5QFK1_9BACT|nr:hypothetical protein [Arcicella rigui]MEA5141407.1 hypothetical protein [Arcicella rigui]
MKKLLLLALFFVSQITFAQNILRVNNTTGVKGVGVYDSFDAAQKAAVNGDIIYLDPSSTSYGSITITKKLTIIGNGFHLANNTNASFDRRTAILSYVYFNQGSQNTTLIGLHITNAIDVNVENITLKRCRLDDRVDIDADRFSLIQSLVMYSGVNGYNSNKKSANCIISNNIFLNSSRVTYLSGASIINNVFELGGSLLYDLEGCIFSNNIIDTGTYTTGIFDKSAVGNSISNNICTSPAGLPSGSGNVNDVNISTIFKISNPWDDINTLEANLQLADNSPAKTAGAGKTPIGIYAGVNPYVQSGLPNIPTVTTFNSSGFGTVNTPLKITINVRSGN